MTALYGFKVGYTVSRPVVPDEKHTFVTVAGEDSFTGYLDARWTAIAEATMTRATPMVTSGSMACSTRNR